MQHSTVYPVFRRIQYIQYHLQVKTYINILIMNREQLVEELKQQIIEQLNLQVQPADIVASDPLFNEGAGTGLYRCIGADSVDATEIPYQTCQCGRWA